MLKKSSVFPPSFFCFLLLFTALSSAFSILTHHPADVNMGLASDADTTPFTVILDAGHGGEDGGAVSASGILEKDLNLEIAFLLRDLLEANGIRVIMTRSTDILLYDRNENYHGRKKALDLAARRKIAEETPNAIFVSIHMNAYPQTQYRGLQVWYSPNHRDSKTLADHIQKTVQELLQPQNGRQPKGATSGIYLLHRLQCPAVLVECGFLSNPDEAALLNDRVYRERLAGALFLAIAESLPVESVGTSSFSNKST